MKSGTNEKGNYWESKGPNDFRYQNKNGQLFNSFRCYVVQCALPLLEISGSVFIIYLGIEYAQKGNHAHVTKPDGSGELLGQKEVLSL